MESRTLTGHLLTPMFSYGENQKFPEFRATELKGMMRYLYRIACPAKLSVLKQDEAELFGGSTGDRKEQAGHASPVQLFLMQARPERFEAESLLLHDEKRQRSIFNCIFQDEFKLRISMDKRISIQNELLSKIADIDWYKEEAALALLLCGMGKRSRKGRGRVMPDEYQQKDKAQALAWICDGLNKIAKATSEELKPEEKKYEIRDGTIYPYVQKKGRNSGNRDLKRPAIKKIVLGECLSEWKESASRSGGKKSLDVFLKAVDTECHYLRGKQKYEFLKDGQILKLSKAIGQIDGKERFASSLIIGFIQTDEGIYPVYTFVKAFPNLKEELDADCSLREQFIEMVEKYRI